MGLLAAGGDRDVAVEKESSEWWMILWALVILALLLLALLGYLLYSLFFAAAAAPVGAYDTPPFPVVLMKN